MKKMVKPLYAVAIALVVLLSGFPLGLVHADTSTYDGAVHQLIKVVGGEDTVEKVVGPDITYTYVYVTNQLLHPTQYIDKGPWNPYAISVQVTSISPGSSTVSVIIKVDGSVVWEGNLGNGQSSPTKTVNGGSTTVRFINNNDYDITFSATITLINN